MKRFSLVLIALLLFAAFSEARPRFFNRGFVRDRNRNVAVVVDAGQTEVEVNAGLLAFPNVLKVAAIINVTRVDGGDLVNAQMRLREPVTNVPRQVTIRTVRGEKAVLHIFPVHRNEQGGSVALGQPTTLLNVQWSPVRDSFALQDIIVHFGLQAKQPKRSIEDIIKANPKPPLKAKPKAPVKDFEDEGDIKPVPKQKRVLPPNTDPDNLFSRCGRRPCMRLSMCRRHCA